MASRTELQLNYSGEHSLWRKGSMFSLTGLDSVVLVLKITTQLRVWSNPIQLNWIPAVW